MTSKKKGPSPIGVLLRDYGTNARKLALGVACPTCGVAAGLPCRPIRNNEWIGSKGIDLEHGFDFHRYRFRAVDEVSAIRAILDGFENMEARGNLTDIGSEWLPKDRARLTDRLRKLLQSGEDRAR